MKVFFLEPDNVLADTLDTYLNSLRQKLTIKKVHEEEEIFQEDVDSLLDYSLFVLNLKHPTDACILHYLRSNGCTAPVLLVLEPNPDRSLFKTLYYLGYDNVITKPFCPEEITFSIYKLCNIWNDENFFITKDIFFDFKHAKFINHNQEVLLGKKEALLLKFLFIKSPHTVSFDEISSYIYQDEIASEERMRSLVRQLRSKIPHDLIETIKGVGYKIVIPKEPSHEKSDISPAVHGYMWYCMSLANAVNFCTL